MQPFWRTARTASVDENPADETCWMFYVGHAWLGVSSHHFPGSLCSRRFFDPGFFHSMPCLQSWHQDRKCLAETCRAFFPRDLPLTKFYRANSCRTACDPGGACRFCLPMYRNLSIDRVYLISDYPNRLKICLIAMVNAAVGNTLNEAVPAPQSPL